MQWGKSLPRRTRLITCTKGLNICLVNSTRIATAFFYNVNYVPFLHCLSPHPKTSSPKGNDRTIFPIIRSKGVFLRRSRAANSVVGGLIWPSHLSPMCQGQISFKKIRTHPSFNACSCYMKVSKGSNQKQQRKSGNTIFPIIRSKGVFLRRSRAANSDVHGRIRPNFELMQALMYVIVTWKYKKDPIKNSRENVMTPFSPL